MNDGSLKRVITLPLLTLYGLGTILGAGIYVLIGEVTATAGVFAPFAFLCAGVVAAFTGLSYSELSSRYPVSAGEAVYLQKGLGSKHLAQVVGWVVILVGITSSATIANGFVGYFQRYFPVNEFLVLTVLVMSLGLLASYGIMESVWVAAVVTLVEVFGLLLVIFLGIPSWNDLEIMTQSWSQQANAQTFSLVAAGAYLAFYAFIGFEDMVNVAEEVKNPRRTLPIAILIALVLSSILYFIISFVALTALPVSLLGSSRAPLVDIVANKNAFWVPAMTVISLVAVVNGALVQIIMVSRVIYGMADKNMAPHWLARVHPVRKTPLTATVITTGVVLVLALGFDLVTLAKLTSGMTLVIFALVNLSLINIKRKQPVPEQIFTVPVWVPWLGLLLNVLVLGYQMIFYGMA